MKNIFFGAVMSICALCPFGLFSQSLQMDDHFESTLLSRSNVAELLTNQLSSYPENTQLSMAIVSGDSIEFIGILLSGDEIKRVDNKDAIFEIGSISKVFTSVIFSNMIEEGLLSTSDKLMEVLPYAIEKVPDGIENVTLETLANHTSGLPRIAQNMYPLMISLISFEYLY